MGERYQSLLLLMLSHCAARIIIIYYIVYIYTCDRTRGLHHTYYSHRHRRHGSNAAAGPKTNFCGFNKPDTCRRHLYMAREAEPYYILLYCIIIYVYTIHNIIYYNISEEKSTRRTRTIAIHNTLTPEHVVVVVVVAHSSREWFFFFSGKSRARNIRVYDSGVWFRRRVKKISKIKIT